MSVEDWTAAREAAELRGHKKAKLNALRELQAQLDTMLVDIWHDRGVFRGALLAFQGDLALEVEKQLKREK